MPHGFREKNFRKICDIFLCVCFFMGECVMIEQTSEKLIDDDGEKMENRRGNRRKGRFPAPLESQNAERGMENL